MDSTMTDAAAVPSIAENDAGSTLAPPAILERRRYNALLPINRLPPELLCAVIANLREVIELVYRRPHYRGLFRVRSVCKYWLSVVDSSPRLWTFVSLQFKDDFLDMILRNSKNHPLSVRYQVLESVTQERVASFAQRVIPLVGRWKSLVYLRGWLPSDKFETQLLSLSLSFPNLESLKSSFNYEGPLDAPKLRFMDVPTFCSDWVSLSDLRSFTARRSWKRYPSVDQLYVLLQNWPKLETLRICPEEWPNRFHDIRDLPPIPLFLPNLRSIVLYLVPVVPYSRLLYLIGAPNLRRFHTYLIFEPDEYDLEPAYEPAGRFLGAYRHTADNDSPTRLRVFTTSNRFTIAVGDFRFTINAIFDSASDSPWSNHQQDCQSALSAILSAFDRRLNENIRVIQFGGTQCGEDLIALGPILQRHFPNVEELVVTLSSSEDHLDGPKLVLETLGSSLPPERGGGWLFPRLTSLRLRAGVEPTCDGILELVEARRNGKVQEIERIVLRRGRIERDTVTKLKTYVKEFRLEGTRYIEDEADDRSSSTDDSNADR